VTDEEPVEDWATARPAKRGARKTSENFILLEYVVVDLKEIDKYLFKYSVLRRRVVVCAKEELLGFCFVYDGLESRGKRD
jgi:hypothetical protein